MTGRIIKGVGGLYTVAAQGKHYEAKARGILRRGLKPAIGDFVEITVTPMGECVIEKLIERKNSLLRPKVVNIDCAVMVFAAKEPDINLEMLDRFIRYAEKENIGEICIALNKCDKDGADEVFEKLNRIYGRIYKLYAISAAEGRGIDELKANLKNKVSVMCGPSGVGKSSIVNLIVPGGKMETGDISKKIKRGKHTTRHIELLEIDSDTYIVDSPGFSSLDLEYLDSDHLCEYFAEFKPYLSGCRFRDCKHIDEPDCKLKEQVGKNISVERYERFKKFYKEIKNSPRF